jgi:hypothetical protein
MQSSFMLLVPHIEINRNGKMVLPGEFNAKIRIFSYDLHEHFKDIRGRHQ